jgi:hypothetical protein
VTEPFYVTGGNLSPDAPCYVERQADTDLLSAIRSGSFCYVLDTRQVGKSSLMVRTAARLRSEGVRVALLDLTGIGQNVTAHQWYNGLLAQLGAALGIEDAIEDFTEAHAGLGPSLLFFEAVRRVALPKKNTPLAIFVDEIDAVRSLSFSTDEFFAGVRALYNRRVELPELGQLTFCLLGSATPDSLVRDVRTTPFNIGVRIEPTDFSPPEAWPLAKGLGEGGVHAIQRVLYWTDGHPYLTQKLCQAIAEIGRCDTDTVDRTAARLFFGESARETETNLSFVQRRVLEGDEDVTQLLDLYRRTRHKDVEEEPGSPLVAALHLAGIVRRVGGRLRVRNKIYATVFDDGWIDRSLPNVEVRRQRRAFLKGFLPTVVALLLILVITVSLAVRATNAERIASDRERQWKRTLEALARERINEADTESANGILLKLAKDELNAVLEENKELRRRLGLSLDEDIRVKQ